MKFIYPTENFVKKGLLKQNPFFLIAVLVFIYFISLQVPLGGIVFMTLGTFIPDAIVILTALGLSKNIKKILVRIIAFIGIIILLIAAANSIQIYEYISSPAQKTGYEITKKIQVNEDYYPTYKTPYKDGIRRAFPNIFLPHFSIGANEGCMCMYFQLNNRKDYFFTTSEHVSSFFEKGGGYRMSNNANPLFIVSLNKPLVSRIAGENTGYTFQVKIVQNGELTAEFWQEGIPEHVLTTKEYKQDDKLKKNFFENVLHLLLRNTLLSQVLSEIFNISYFPSDELDIFLKEAIEINYIKDNNLN